MKIIAVSLALALGAGSAPSATEAKPVTVAQVTANPAHVAALKKALEGLWIGHIDAVRKVDIATIAGDPAGVKAAEAEVVANAHAFGDAVGGFYGKAAGEQLFTLLAGHYGAVKAYLDATVAHDSTAQSKATSQLTDNADKLAAFFAGANPYLPQDQVGEMLLTHGSQHITQIQQLMAKTPGADAKTAAAMKTHVIMIGDAMAEAIAKQFPSKV